jgi:hypothetical protein
MIYYSTEPSLIEPTPSVVFTRILNDHSWDSPGAYLSVSNNNVFTVVVNGVSTTFNKINESYVVTRNNHKKIEIVATNWAGCDLSDYYRTIIKLSTELYLNYELPLDPLITGSN